VTDVIGFQVTLFTRGYDAGALVSDLFAPYHVHRPAPPWLTSFLLHPDDAGPY
jgi:hypothetical protein